MYGRERHLPLGLARHAYPPASAVQGFNQLHRAEPFARTEPPRRAGKRLPEPVRELFQQKHLRVAPRRAPKPQPRRKHLRVVDDDELARELIRELGEDVMPHRARRAIEDEQPGGVAKCSTGCCAISSGGSS